MNSRLPDKPRKWSRVTGSVYLLCCEDPDRWFRKRYVGYVGMYSGDWKERVRQHLYGGGRYDCEPKVWADLVPGYSHTATTRRAQQRAVEEAIRLGGAQLLWQKECFYWYVKLRESWAIAWRLPVHNIRENLHNPRHIPQWVAEEQRTRRDARRARRGLSGSPLPTSDASGPVTQPGHRMMRLVSAAVVLTIGASWWSGPDLMGWVQRWWEEHSVHALVALVLAMSLMVVVIAKRTGLAKRTRRPHRRRLNLRRR